MERVCVPGACKMPKEAEEFIGCTGAGVTGSCEWAHMVLGTRLGSPGRAASAPNC